MANSGRPAKWRDLLKDDEVRRWHEQLSFGSVSTAEERIRVLGRVCETLRLNPRELADLARDANGGRRKVEDLLMDLAGKMHRARKSPGYIANIVKVVKSWLLFNEVALVRKIRVGDATATPTIEAERIPTKAELHAALSVADERGKAIIALCALSALRPEVLGNRRGTDGLTIRDLPDIEIRKDRVRFRMVPAKVVVRKSLSKTKKPFFTFLPAQGCRYVADYLERRMARGEVFEPGSPLIRVGAAWEKRGRPVDGPAHGSPFLTTPAITKEIRKFLWTQVRLRPYVLRSYAITNLETAERNGKITLSDRKFVTGRTDDIDRRYSTGKMQLPEDVVEAIRREYAEASAFLMTETPAIPIETLRLQESQLLEEIGLDGLHELIAIAERLQASKGA
jgi:integrase